MFAYSPRSTSCSWRGVVAHDRPAGIAARLGWDTCGVTDEPQPNAPDVPVVGPAPGPPPNPAKPRLLQDGRDMFWSLAPLVIGCILLAGLFGMCSVQPGGTGKGKIPSYDAAAALRADAQGLGFPIRVPQLPAGWQAKSGDRDGTRHVLTQSTAEEDKLVASIHPSAYPSGAVDVGGVSWVVYQGTGQGADAEPVWTTRLPTPGGAAHIAITVA